MSSKFEMPSKIDFENFMILRDKIGDEKLGEILTTFCNLIEKDNVPYEEVESLLILISQIYEAKYFGFLDVLQGVLDKKEPNKRNFLKFIKRDGRNHQF